MEGAAATLTSELEVDGHDADADGQQRRLALRRRAQRAALALAAANKKVMLLTPPPIRSKCSTTFQTLLVQADVTIVASGVRSTARNPPPELASSIPKPLALCSGRCRPRQ